MDLGVGDPFAPKNYALPECLSFTIGIKNALVLYEKERPLQFSHLVKDRVLIPEARGGTPI